MEQKYFMLDIETTGIDPKKEELLQIAALEMSFSPKDGLWQAGKEFVFFQNTSRVPETVFAQRHMEAIYQECQKAPFVPAREVRKSLLHFFASCGQRPPYIYFCGWNVGIFDIPFLAHHDYLSVAHYDGESLQGDCHYRTYEISGVLSYVANLLGHQEVNAVIREAQKIFPPPKGTRHEALFDCKRQLCILNGALEMVRKKKV